MDAARRELAGRPHRLSPTAIGLFGLVGIAGALTARHAGRLADRGRGRAASGTALVLMLAGWLPIALAGWSLAALVAGMVLVDVAVQAVHVISLSLVAAVDPRARSPLVAAYGVFYSVGSAARAAGSVALHAALGWAGVAILGAAISAAGLAYWAASRQGDRQRRPAPSPLHRAHREAGDESPARGSVYLRGTSGTGVGRCGRRPIRDRAQRGRRPPGLWRSPR